MQARIRTSCDLLVLGFGDVSTLFFYRRGKPFLTPWTQKYVRDYVRRLTRTQPVTTLFSLNYVAFSFFCAVLLTAVCTEFGHTFVTRPRGVHKRVSSTHSPNSTFSARQLFVCSKAAIRFESLTNPRQQTQSPATVPSKVAENFAKYGSGWTRRVYNDSECLAFLVEYFNPSVAELFASLEHGAHKADLVRYALMYIFGGVYFDIKAELITPLDYMFPSNTEVMPFLVRSALECCLGTVHNGIMFSPPGWPLFLEMISFMLAVGPHITDYHYNIRHLYRLANACPSDCIANNEKCSNTVLSTCNISGTPVRFGFEVNASKEECYDGLDRYKLCDFVVERTRNVFKVRYADYQGAWGR